jgi:rsbT co-antagonist protein RsbR
MHAAARVDAGVTLEDWAARKAFVRFGTADETILRELHLVALAYADQVMDELYGRWLEATELRSLLSDGSTLLRVKSMQRDYFISLTRGDYGAAYLAHRLHVGRVHKRIGVTPRWYMGAYAIYLEIVLPRVLGAFEFDRERQRRAVTALTKLIALDQELALTAYFEAQ